MTTNKEIKGGGAPALARTFTAQDSLQQPGRSCQRPQEQSKHRSPAPTARARLRTIKYTASQYRYLVVTVHE